MTGFAYLILAIWLGLANGDGPQPTLDESYFRDRDARVASIEAIPDSALSNPAVVDSLLAIAIGDLDDAIRYVAVERLLTARAAPAILIPRLTNALEDDRWEIRSSALEVIAELRPPDATLNDRVALALRDTSNLVRYRATFALGSLGPLTPLAVSEFVRLSRGDLTFGDFGGMIDVLRNGGAAARLGLRDVLHDPNVGVRLIAVAGMPDTLGAENDFIAAMRDSDEVVRGAALSRLAEIEPRSVPVRDALESALLDSNELNREFAKTVLGSNPDATRRLSRVKPGDAILNADTTQFVIPVDVEHYREPTELEQMQGTNTSGALARFFELMVYDLPTRTGPRRIASWALKEGEQRRAIGWKGHEIAVSYSRADEFREERVEPNSGTVRDLGRTTREAMVDGAINANNSASLWVERHRTHIEERSGEYFLWRMQTRTRERLFAFPSHHDGLPDPDSVRALPYRERNRYADTIHGVWNVVTSEDEEGARFEVETFVRRPGVESRRYVVRIAVDMPDTAQEAQHVYATIPVELLQEERTLGPSGTTFTVPVKTARLRELLAPYRRSRRLHPPSWQTSVWVSVRPVPRKGDEERIPGGILSGEAHLGYTHVRFPIP